MVSSLKKFMKNNRNILIIIGFNLIISCIFLALFGLKYYMDDNKYFAIFIAEGYYESIFTNYFLLAFCGLVQSIVYPINAFSLVSIILAEISFISIHFVFYKRQNLKWSFLIMTFIYAFFGVNHINSISFTLLPTLLASSGFLLIINSLHDNYKVTKIIIGTLLVIFSSFYRFKIFLSCFAVIGVLYLIIYFIDLRNEKDKIRVSIRKLFNLKFVSILMIVLITTFSFNFISQQINISTDELIYYKEYTSLRSQVWDHEIPSYYEAKDDYDKIGITENDLDMLKNQYFDDNGAFSIDTLNQIVQIRDSYTTAKGVLVSFVSMCKILFSNTFFTVTEIGITMWALIGLSLLYIIFMKKKYYFILASSIILILFFYTYLWIGARAPYRAIYSVIFSCIVLLIYSLSSKGINDKFKKFFTKKITTFFSIFVSIILLFMITPMTYTNSSAVNNKINYISGHDELVNYINENSDKKFVVGQAVSASDSYNLQKPLQIRVPELHNNAITFYGTYHLSPYANHKAELFGADNVYSYLINNKDAYFVDTIEQNQYKMFERYLNDHYANGSEIEMSLYKSIGDYRIYSVRNK